jgi:hypothetical protein
MYLEEMSFFDSQSTTPTRSSFDHQYDHQDEHIKRLETIPSVLQDSNGERHNRFDPSPSRSRRSSETKAEEEDIEKEAGFTTGDASKEAAAAVPDKDPNLVEWDGPDDPENPQNFTRAKKWTITMLLSSLTIWVTFSTSVFSQATQITAEEFGVSDEVMILATSLPLFVCSISSELTC